MMRLFKHSALLVGLSMSLLTINAWMNSAKAQNPTPILDQYAYTLSGDVMIDLTNQNIIIESDMVNCQQENGQPPIDTTAYALYTNNQFIGLVDFKYDTYHNKINFYSETNDLICDNGVFVDVLFTTSFEPALLN